LSRFFSDAPSPGVILRVYASALDREISRQTRLHS